MSPIAFNKDLSFEYGVLEPVAPRVRRMVAPNPGPFTHFGTGTYVVGEGKVAVIDPGPACDDHLQALLRALRGEEVTHILVTHTHLDHSPGARALSAATGAPTYGFGPHAGGRYADAEVGASADLAFVPDHELAHGEVVAAEGFTLEAVHTPGHCSNHLCFQLREHETLFTGDHVMGWSTTVIAPPDGDMGAYLASLRALLHRNDARYLPTHGAPVDDPKRLVASLIEHRNERERQILRCLAQGITRVRPMVARMYQDVPHVLHEAAARSVFAHVLHMIERELLVTDDARPSLDSHYRLA